METNKFEKRIAKEMNEREITPSFGAWDRITAQLGNPKKTNKKAYFWYAIAASFIGMLVISILFQKDNTSPNGTEDKIVNAPNDDFNQDRKKGDLLNDKAGEVKFEADAIPSEKSIKSHIPDSKQQELSKPDLSKKLRLKTEIAQNLKESKKEDVAGERKAVMDEKIAEVLARVNVLEASDNATLSDVEVDSLLKNAQQELLTNKIFNENRSVDAMALLNEVEGELDRTFRSQIFETLKNGFLKARTAVVDRNN